MFYRNDRKILKPENVCDQTKHQNRIQRVIKLLNFSYLNITLVKLEWKHVIVVDLAQIFMLFQLLIIVYGGVCADQKNRTLQCDMIKKSRFRYFSTLENSLTCFILHGFCYKQVNSE